MTSVSVLRVFTDDNGASGNALGVVRDAGAIERDRRQAIAAELGFSETIFVEDATGIDAGPRVQIFTPQVELAFAGHPMVGAAWLLRAPVLQIAAGEVRTRIDGARAWVLARAEWCPPFERRQLASPTAVDSFQAPSAGSLQVWAWSDERAGRIRARVFAPAFGVGEDPATGSAAVALCAVLGRAITIDQGPHCQIVARPQEDGWVELGGRVADDGATEV
jgi:predicted PhzF superfamily epimerase YddE/YHI9